MLIEMNVSNFRSFKEKQTLSMVKAKGNELPDNAFTAQMSSGKSIDLLHSAAIYGANASGKSNVLKALMTMHDIVVNSHNIMGKLPIHPFKLDTKSRQEPTEFEVTILIDKVRYQYGFSATEKQIYDEWLFVYPKGKAQVWFEREWNEEKQAYDWDFSNYLTGEKQLWKKATRNNALFLSTAVQLNSEKLKPLFDWFAHTLKMTGLNTDYWDMSFTAKQCQTEQKNDILNLIKVADLGIDDFNVHIKKTKWHLAATDRDIPDTVKEKIPYEFEEILIQSIHKDNEKKSVLLNLNSDESDGTKRFFSFAAPFLHILENGSVVFIDELNNSLHPKLVQFLVELFHNKEKNQKNAQLIFTTHDTTILNQEVFRRDQIWFCEKNQDNATTLYPLSDFKPRKGVENLEAAYLSGRYGALPFIQPFHLGE
ncbi:MAG: ATP-binding protein [Neisseriaceae bacterium]|nr:ATP-binding protein [Neisseriaceae bacterium]